MGRFEAIFRHLSRCKSRTKKIHANFSVFSTVLFQHGSSERWRHCPCAATSARQIQNHQTPTAVGPLPVLVRLGPPKRVDGIPRSCLPAVTWLRVTIEAARTSKAGISHFFSLLEKGGGDTSRTRIGGGPKTITCGIGGHRRQMASRTGANEAGIFFKTRDFRKCELSRRRSNAWTPDLRGHHLLPEQLLMPRALTKSLFRPYAPFMLLPVV